MEKRLVGGNLKWVAALPPVSDFSTRRIASTSHHRQLFVYLAEASGCYGWVWIKWVVHGWLGGCVVDAFFQAYPLKTRICLALCQAPFFFFDVLTPRPGLHALNPRVEIHKLNSSNILAIGTF